MIFIKFVARVIIGYMCVLYVCNYSTKGSHLITNFAEESQLIFAHVVFRHGERNVMSFYPTSLYKNESFWPGGLGALTKNGKQTHYKLGKYLRTRYQHLIGSDYSANQIYIRSTDEDRNLMSAECTVAGMFPPSVDEIWNDDLNWQPIPIHTMPLEDDYLLNSFVDCSRFEQLFQQRLNSDELKSLMEQHRTLIDFMEKNSGLKLQKVDDVWKLYSGLLIEYRRELCTDWVTEALKSNDILEYISATSYQSATYYTEQKKQRSGFLIKEILDRFKNKTLSLLKPDRSLWIYVVHSTGMVNILNSLNLFEELHIPPLSSSILFELRKRNQDFYVQIFYRKTVTDDVQPLNIPNCGIMCSLDRFYVLYKNILPTEDEDFYSLCHVKN